MMFIVLSNGEACYLSDVGRVRAYSYLHHLCMSLPVHIIYGAINDLLFVLPTLLLQND